ncbi:hypothetical protein U9M48_044880 [Paspalum notatum var. saurae]|uniref:F-box domain-containing protein n=1 Tax=Paspalum notatum var. saurae TaxID=547442 RepID=A0AAQ3XIZ8_PASNO
MEPPPPPAAARRDGESGTGGTMEPAPSAAPDLLSSLQADMRDELLLRLDLRSAVRTSALSRTWRRLWESLGMISLCFPKGTPPSIVDSVLLRYTGPRISRFAVYVDEACAGRIDDWVIALSGHNVDSIDISGYFGVPLAFNLHSSIFSCGSLTSLELSLCNLPPLPVGFAGFPALQVLLLNYVNFPANGGNELEVIIRQSPSLQYLTLHNVFIPEDCPDSLIQAPNLRSLNIFSEYDDGWIIGELPCLEDADMMVSFYDHHPHDFGDFLARFAPVRKLTLFTPVEEVKVPHELPFTFHNLKNLKLCTHFIHMNSILLTFTLLRSCPNLEHLEIEIIIDSDQTFEADLEFLNAKWTDGMCDNLQVVQMIDIARLPNEISFMELILTKARLLRKLYISACPYSIHDPLAEILKCQRASPQARILFKVACSWYLQTCTSRRNLKSVGPLSRRLAGADARERRSGVVMEPPPAAAAATDGVDAARRSGESGTGDTMEPSPSAAPDLLSSLPADLRDELLLRLDLRGAVRTSALSRAWRRLWESLGMISLCFPKGTPPSIVDSVLLRYTGPRISRFAVYVDEACAGRVDDWVIALSGHNVDSIDISGYFGVPLPFNLHSSIFSCGSLTSLELSLCNIPPLPVGFAGFPALQVLLLNYVYFPANGGNELEVIIRQSPSLQYLTLHNVLIPGDCPDSLIQAPNLRSLNIFSEYDDGWIIGELPCLEDADMMVSFYDHHPHDFGDFLARFAPVRKFTLFTPVEEVKVPHTLPFTFDNLKNLKLCTHFIEMDSILLTFTLLRSCPNIEHLEIEIIIDSDQTVEADLEFLNAVWTDGMCDNLQVVQMTDIARLPNEISFMELILTKARLLRTFLKVGWENIRLGDIFCIWPNARLVHLHEDTEDPCVVLKEVDVVLVVCYSSSVGCSWCLQSCSSSLKLCSFSRNRCSS